jgi:PhnB protein
MSNEKKHVRQGFGAVRPFLYGRLDLPEFVKKVFGATELERNSVPGGFHVESKIGDSVVVMAAMDPPYEAATRASIYVYVDDVDATYSRAIAAGAASISEPADKPYQERAAGIRDSFGNIWYIATYIGQASK